VISREKRRRVRSRGTILLAVMFVTVLTAMVAASLLFRMGAESAASSGARSGRQAYLAAMSGLAKVSSVLRSSLADSTAWYDDEDTFRERFVTDDGSTRWYFTVYAQNFSDPDDLRYGVTDEGGKINLNTADETTLLALPGMTRERVDCLLDYRDRDDDVRAEGGEQEYYDTLAYPYRIKNAPLVTLEELLMVKGFDASVVSGEDANFNFRLDPNEDDGEERFPSDDANGLLDRGLRAVATVVSYEPNVDNSGQPRVNLNGDPDDLSDAGLDAQTEQFIRLYRGENSNFTDPADLLNMRYTLQRNATLSTSGRRGRGQTFAAGTELRSGVDASNLATVLDRLSASPAAVRMGLLNVNTARAEALSAIDGIDEDLARRIVDLRSDLDSETKGTIAWLYTQNVLDEAEFKNLAPKLTARSFQFRVQCVGFGWPSGRFRVIEASVDLASGEPRVTYLRDITRLGLPFAIDLSEESGTN
jgi:type II secretory pathway component PulK